MHDILDYIKTPYVDAQTLLTLLQDYQKPREHISRLVKNKKLIRLKNGFYLIYKRTNQEFGSHIPFEQVANLLYGPSYISLEWALSFYGMIPEKVHLVTSMTMGKDKEFQTPIGNFTYYSISKNRYAVGITRKKISDLEKFFIATPEKALADLVYKRCKGLSKSELAEDLIESKRIDQEYFRELDKDLLKQIGAAYRSKSVNYLIDLVGVL